MELTNRICPKCKNPNYMVCLGDFSERYKYKCMNCNRYFNDIDFEEEPLQPVWKSECMNSKVDMVEVVRCKDCKHRPTQKKCFPDMVCPCQCSDSYYSWVPPDDWYCADGERKGGDGE